MVPYSLLTYNPYCSLTYNPYRPLSYNPYHPSADTNPEIITLTVSYVETLIFSYRSSAILISIPYRFLATLIIS